MIISQFQAQNKNTVNFSIYYFSVPMDTLKNEDGKQVGIFVLCLLSLGNFLDIFSVNTAFYIKITASGAQLFEFQSTRY